jgi:hypothetical protein
MGPIARLLPVSLLLACLHARPIPGRVPSLSVAQMVTEWLGASVVFPE